jgi:hypothetical protein
VCLMRICDYKFAVYGFFAEHKRFTGDKRICQHGCLSTEVRSVRFEKTLGKFSKELLPNIAVVQDFDCGDFLVQNSTISTPSFGSSGIHR